MNYTRIICTSRSLLSRKVRCIHTSYLKMNNKKPVIPVVSAVGVVTELSQACNFATFVDINYEDVSVELLQDAEIIIGDPPILAPVIFQLPKLKWVHSLYAGVNAFFEHLPPNKPPSFITTRLAGLFGPVMAEYVVGQIIAHERKFALSWQAQKDKIWLPWEHFHYRSLSEMSIGIIGYGDIGQQVAKYCKAMGMTVNIVQRKPSSEKLPFVDNVFTLNELADCLKQSDYFCNVLPSTPATCGLLSGNVLESCKERKTVFINIGRGDVIDEESILKSLNNNWIGGAILDVTNVEPLPGNSPLWNHPQITITPHNSGLVFGRELIDGFIENFPLYQCGKPLKHTVDWNKGY